MKLFNNLNRKLPKKEKELIQNISNNLLSLIEKSLDDKNKCHTVEIYKKEIDEYKNNLEILKNENKQLIGELRILRDAETIIKQKNDKLNKINKDISDKLKECEIKIKQYEIVIKDLQKINNNLKNELSINKTMLLSITNMLFKAYEIICNDLKALIDNIKQPVINIIIEINKCKVYDPTIEIDDSHLEIKYQEYINILKTSTFENDFIPYVDDKVAIILTEIDNIKKNKKITIETVENSLVIESNKLREIYNILNYLYNFYQNDIDNKVIEIID